MNTACSGRERTEPPVTNLPADTTSESPVTNLRSGTLTTSGHPEPALELSDSIAMPEYEGANVGRVPSREVQNDYFDGRQVITGESSSADDNAGSVLSDFSAGTLIFAFGKQLESPSVAVSSVAFAATGLELVNDIWHIPALQADTEHLQDITFRLVFKIAEAIGCPDCVCEDKNPTSVGFSVSANAVEFSLFLAGLSGSLPNGQLNMFMLFMNFFGYKHPADTLVFDDITVVKAMRIISALSADCASCAAPGCQGRGQ